MGKIVPTEEAQVPAGTYNMRFDEFTVRDNNVPVLKQTDKGQKLYFQLLITDGDHQGEVVPASSDVEGFSTWVQLLTGKPMQTRDLAALEKQLQEAGKVIEMAVGDKGWARGPVVPKGAYMAKYVGFTQRDANGKPVISAGEYKGTPTRKVYWKFDVVAGEYTGVIVPASSPYSATLRGQNLQISSKSNLFSWCTACGVDFAAVPELADMNNALPELEQIMLKAAAIVVIQVDENGWVDSSQAGVAKAPAGMAPVGAPAPAEVHEADKVGDLYLLMNKLATQLKLADLFEKDGALSAAGKAFASEHIAPICLAHGIPKAFKKMSDEQAEVVSKELNAKFQIQSVQTKAAEAPEF